MTDITKTLHDFGVRFGLWNEEAGRTPLPAHEYRFGGEPHELHWFRRYGSQFSGKYVILSNGEKLKLHRHVFPDGNYTYLALPADEEQLRAFLTGVIAPLAWIEEAE